MSSSASAFRGLQNVRYYCDLYHGEYCDIDEDGEEDDLRIHAEIFTYSFPRNYDMTLFMYLLIEMPSGAYLEYLWEVSIYYLQDYSFEYQVIDGALEPGWYDTYLLIFEEDFQWYDGDFISFDPPQSKGNNADPLCQVLVSY